MEKQAWLDCDNQVPYEPHKMPQYRRRGQKPFGRLADILTLQLAWEQMLPGFEVPEEGWLRAWLNRATVEEVLGAFEHAAKRRRKREIKDAQHCGRAVSAHLSRQQFRKIQ